MALYDDGQTHAGPQRPQTKLPIVNLQTLVLIGMAV